MHGSPGKATGRDKGEAYVSFACRLADDVSQNVLQARSSRLVDFARRGDLPGICVNGSIQEARKGAMCIGISVVTET